MSVIWFLFAMVIVFIISLYVLYDVIFSGNKKYMCDEHSLPSGEQYEPYHKTITKCVEQVLEVEFEPVEIYAKDGCRLYGRYYHLNDHAPLIIFFHCPSRAGFLFL